MNSRPTDDASAMSLTTEYLHVSISPAQGGKITEIIDLRTGRNLLAMARPGSDLPLPDGAVFSIAGWDEAVPSVEASNGVPDLGYAWRTPAECRIEDNHLLTRWEIPGWAVEREVIADGRGLAVCYAITNLLDSPAPLLWAAHVLFPVEKLLRIDLPAGDLLPGPQCIIDDLTRRLQRDATGWHVHDMTDDDMSWKFFLANRQPVVLVYADAAIELTGAMPWWGIWLNEGRFGPLCLGIEPTNAPSDALADSLTVIEPHAVFRASWQLSIT